MTKFKEYILNESSLKMMNREDILIKIREKCKPILKEMKKSNFYLKRIANRLEKFDFLYGKTYKNRMPTDTLSIYHNVIDNYFKSEFGWKARSENVLFVYGKQIKHIKDDRIHNTSLKRSYVAFPIGNFKFLWSDKVDDMTDEFNLMDYDDLYYDDDYDEKEEINSDIKSVLDYIKKSDYKTTNFIEAMKSGNEIMIKCKEYYLISSGVFDIRLLLEDLIS